MREYRQLNPTRQVCDKNFGICRLFLTFATYSSIPKYDMRRYFVSSLFLAFCVTLCATVDFDTHFSDNTLRLDYSFCGDRASQQVFLDELIVSEGWYGRRVNLDRLLLDGNGQVIVTDTLGHDTLYIYSFSTLFQEWLTYEESTRVRRSFENSLLVPFPRHAVDVTVRLFDTHHRVTACLTHRVNPSDILIRHAGERHERWRYVLRNGDSKEKIDVAFVAEGYTESEMGTFYKDCDVAIKSILSHEPFKSMSDRFNFIAVPSPSVQSGITVPHDGKWLDTALKSHYDTFYTDRYLTTLKVKNLHNILAGIPYEHIFILANTETYGGGGIYNSYTISSVHNSRSLPVIVHEFGHAFGGLADEYFYDDMDECWYPADTEPWEPNITTLVDFSLKWRDMLSPSALQSIPTKADGKEVYTRIGVYEGAGYQSKGAYRPVQECRMKINEAPAFCPVCQRALRRMIEYHTDEQ